MTYERLSTAELGPVAATLLTPLFARANPGTVAPGVAFKDPVAARLLNSLDYEPARVLRDRSNGAGTIHRSLAVDRLTEQFARSHPDAVVVSAGIGLCSRSYRLAGRVPRSVGWVGIDAADVLEVRRRLLPDEQVELVAGSVTQPGWAASLGLAADRPVLVLAEGLVMYFDDAGLAQFLTEARRFGPGAELVADYFHPTVARSDRHPIVKATGARFRSGARNGAELARRVAGWRLVSEEPVMELIGPGQRLAANVFRLASRGGRMYAVAHLEVADQA